MKAHKHAELIKAWADGAVIEFYDADSDEWRPCPAPSWYLNDRYRIKPAEPAYPVTQMTGEEFRKLLVQNRGLCESVTMARIVANAALRHACDAGQVVPREEFDRAVGDRKARDMAVAQEVKKAMEDWFLQQSYVSYRIAPVDLQAAIERAKP